MDAAAYTVLASQTLCIGRLRTPMCRTKVPHESTKSPSEEIEEVRLCQTVMAQQTVIHMPSQTNKTQGVYLILSTCQISRSKLIQAPNVNAGLQIFRFRLYFEP